MYQPDISLVLPAYNEAARIGSTLRDAEKFFTQRSLAYELIVVADGTDGTREAARAHANTGSPIIVAGEAFRRGKGKGVREGVAAASGRWIGYADADNKVPIEEFEKFEPLLREGAPVVIGSRAISGSAILKRQPLYREIGGRGFHYFMKAVVGLPQVRDTQCGFKFFQRDVAKLLFQAQHIDGYMFDVEILSLASRMGFRIHELPIQWRDDGDSRLDLIAGNVRNMRDIFRIGLGRTRFFGNGHPR